MAPKSLNSDQLDQYLRLGVIALILIYVFFYGSVFEESYPHKLVELHDQPWWRLILVVLVAIGAWWCPRVGIAVAIAVYLYLNDMHILTTPFLSTTSK
jgi:hypothetical protein